MQRTPGACPVRGIAPVPPRSVPRLRRRLVRRGRVGHGRLERMALAPRRPLGSRLAAAGAREERPRAAPGGDRAGARSGDPRAAPDGRLRAATPPDAVAGAVLSD